MLVTTDTATASGTAATFTITVVTRTVAGRTPRLTTAADRQRQTGPARPIRTLRKSSHITQSVDFDNLLARFEDNFIHFEGKTSPIFTSSHFPCS